MFKKFLKIFKKNDTNRRQWSVFKKKYSEYREIHNKIHNEEYHYLMNLKYEIFDEIQKGIKPLIPKVKNTDETLDDILANKKSVCRYGDGEFLILIDRFEDESFFTPAEQLENSTVKKRFDRRNCYFKQKRSPELIERLRLILKSNNENILVCIPNFFGSLQGCPQVAKDSYRFFLAKMRDELVNYIDFEKVYGDAFVSRPSFAYRESEQRGRCFEKIKRIWEDRDIVVVEGEGSRLGVGNDLFNGAKSVERVLCPSESAFDKYSEILNYTKSLPKEKLILIALGMTATVLAYDLAQEGFQAIDIGHIDMEYEIYRKECGYITELPNKYMNDLSHRNYGEIKDEKYLSQIINKIVN